MTPTDFRSDVVPKIADLAEAMDRKPPGDAAIRVWWSVLESLPVHAACYALLQWGRTKSKFPAPAEIYAIASDIDAERREERIAADRATVDRETAFMGSTPQGRRALRMIRDAISANASQARDGRAWARRIIDRYSDGGAVPDLSLRYACDAAGRDIEDVRAMRGGA